MVHMVYCDEKEKVLEKFSVVSERCLFAGQPAGKSPIDGFYRRNALLTGKGQRTYQRHSQ